MTADRMQLVAEVAALISMVDKVPADLSVRFVSALRRELVA